MSNDDLNRVEILLAEILNNVVEHACAGQPRSRINIEYFEDGPHLRFTVTDKGRTMPDENLPQRPLEPPSATAAPEGGFGWFLISELAEGLDYRREADCNVLSLSIRRSGDFRGD